MLPATPSSGNRLSLFTGNSTGALTGINWVITREGEEHPSPLAVDFLGRAVGFVEFSPTTSTTNPAGWSPRAHVGIASQAPPCPRRSGLNIIGLIAVSLDRTPRGLVSIAVRWCHPIFERSLSTITHVGELAEVEDLHETPSHEQRKGSGANLKLPKLQLLARSSFTTQPWGKGLHAQKKRLDSGPYEIEPWQKVVVRHDQRTKECSSCQQDACDFHKQNLMKQFDGVTFSHFHVISFPSFGPETERSVARRPQPAVPRFVERNLSREASVIPGASSPDV